MILGVFIMKYCMLVLIAIVGLLAGNVFAQDKDCIQFSWNPPTAYESGDVLNSADIGNYEIGTKKKADATYKANIIPGGLTKTYTLCGYPAGEYDFRIATVTTDGTYSAFVTITGYKVSSPKPKAPTEFRAATK